MSVPPTAEASAAPAGWSVEERASSGSRLGSLLRWISTLSLDAPLVALAWLFAIGRPTAWEAAALALAVWWGYAVDRWLDGWKRDVVQQGAARHRFAARHRWLWGAWLVAVCAVSFAVIPAHLAARLVSAGGTLAAALVLYTALDQLWPAKLRAFAQRELWVASAVAAAIVLFAGWGTRGAAELAGAAPIAFALVALCAADCRAIRLLEGARRADAGVAGSRGVLALCALSWITFASIGALPQAAAALGFGAFLAFAFGRRPAAAEPARTETVAPGCDLALAALGFAAALGQGLLERGSLLAS